MYAEAFAGAKAYLSSLYNDPEVQEALDRGYKETGYPRAMARAAEVLAARFRKTYVIPTDISTLYVAAGDQERALEWLERAFEAHDPNLPYLDMPYNDSLRSDPRFQALLRRMNLPP